MRRHGGRPPRVPRALEKVEQQHIINLVGTLGGVHYTIGRPPKKSSVHKGTGQTAGIPDLWIFLPPVRRAVNPLPAIGFWWEVKRQGGTRTKEQDVFGNFCQMSQTGYGWGTCNDFIAFLIAAGRIKPDQVPHYRRPEPDDTPSAPASGKGTTH